MNRITIVPVTNTSEVRFVWKLKLSATSALHQHPQLEATTAPQDTITLYSSTMAYPGCNCWIKLCARLEIQRAGIALRRLHIERIHIKNSGFMRHTGAQHDHAHRQEFCILVKLQCEGTSTDTYWKATV